MEINGVANIKLITDVSSERNYIKDRVADKINRQLILLEKYMKTYPKNPDIKWHEIIAIEKQKEEYATREHKQGL